MSTKLLPWYEFLSERIKKLNDEMRNITEKGKKVPFELLFEGNELKKLYRKIQSLCSIPKSGGK